MKQPNLALYGSTTCPETARTRAFLDGRSIPYEFKDVDENPGYREYVATLNEGRCVTPAIRLDNQTLMQPTDEELERAVRQAAAERS